MLDGRNRLAACEKAGGEPTFTEFEGDDAAALALVELLNVQRRDLTKGQRAIVAARRWMLKGDTRDSRPAKASETPTLSVKELAKRYGVTDKPIMQARDLLAEAPDLASQVEACVLSPAAAYEELQGRVGAAVHRRNGCPMEIGAAAAGELGGRQSVSAVRGAVSPRPATP